MNKDVREELVDGLRVGEGLIYGEFHGWGRVGIWPIEMSAISGKLRDWDNKRK